MHHSKNSARSKKMVNNKKSQAAFEYLATYGWAIITALVVVGALAYFGFLNPTNLLPNKCDFGKQMECVEYRIVSQTGEVNLILRNNFGKDIEITEVNSDEIVPKPTVPNPQLIIPSGEKGNLDVTLGAFPTAGEKKEVAITITFKRDGNYPEHNVSGTVFVTVQ